MHTEFCMTYLLANDHLEDQERGGRITLRLILGKPLQFWEVSGINSCMCTVVGFDINNVEPSCSAAGLLIT
jgi:hypothetical protein